jgi:shikimate kinase
VETIRRRIHADTQRPSLTGTKSFVDEIEDVLRHREPAYTAAAHDTIATDARTPAEVAELIYERFQGHL